MASRPENGGAPPPLDRRSQPRLLLLRHPHHFSLLDRPLPDGFCFLKPWESPLPFDDFLSSADARSAEAILTSARAPVTADLLRRLPEVRLVISTSAGHNHIDLAECWRRGIAVAGAGDTKSEEVADLVVGLLIDVLRKVSASDRYVRRGLWSSEGEFALGSKLGGKRVGIIGLGRIGLEVAKRLEAFGCAVSYNSRKKKPYVSYPFYSNVCELATNCDVLGICCGLNEQTHHMINREVLLALGKKGVIVNIGRGPIIDEKEMVQLLVQGELGGAGLDVFEKEPYVPEELLGLDNVVLSPHVAVLPRKPYQIYVISSSGTWKLSFQISHCFPPCWTSEPTAPLVYIGLLSPLLKLIKSALPRSSLLHIGLNTCALMASVLHHYEPCLVQLTHYLWPLDR